MLYDKTIIKRADAPNLGGTGVGTDIFVRKIGPAAHIGEGYAIDIYQSGVKIETIKLPRKKDVIELIKDYKSRYNTNRAFENEKQVHITYKTKEERGETAMHDIDSILLKKASYVGELLQKLIDPFTPIKIREANVMDGSIDFIPETPGETVLAPEQVGTMIATKFVEFVISRQPQQGQEWVKMDELYNPIKKWLTAVKKKLKDYDGMSNAPLDIDTVIKVSESIIQSGDPATIQKATQVQVTPDAAAKIKELANMKAGNTRSNQGGQPDAPLINTINPNNNAAPVAPMAKAAFFDNKKEKEEDNEEDNEEKEEKVSLDGSTIMTENNITPQKAENILNNIQNIVKKVEQKVTNMDDNKSVDPSSDIIQFVVEEKGFNDETSDDAIGKMQDLLEEKKDPNAADIKILNAHFWDYAKRANKVASVEEVYSEWINSFENMNLETSKEVWASINEDLENLFRNKAAMKTGAELVHLQEFCKSLIEPKFQQLLEHLKTGKRNIELFGIFELVKDVMKELMDYSNNDEMKRGNTPLTYFEYNDNPSVLVDAKHTLEEVIKEISKRLYLDKNTVPVEKKEINDYREKLLAEIRKINIKPSDVSNEVVKQPTPKVNQLNDTTSVEAKPATPEVSQVADSPPIENKEI